MQIKSKEESVEKDQFGDICRVLDIKPVAQKVLRLLILKGSLSVVDASNFLHIPKSSIYDALEQLIGQSIVIEYAEGRSKTFGISSMEHLEDIYKNKMKELAKAHTSLLSFITEHKGLEAEGAISKPKIQFYYGVEGIRQAFRDIPWVKKYTDTYLMWPTNEMVDMLGDTFLNHHASGRYIYGVKMKIVNKYSDKGNIPDIYKFDTDNPIAELTEARFAPKDMEWKISYWIYGDRCLFAGSGEEKYAFVVHSQEFVQLMKILWQQVWEVSKK